MVDYLGARVFKTGPWGQGPVFLQQLRLLEGFDLGALDPSSTDSLHLWLETAKLAFADRDACYGDPRFADVPIEALLSRDYAAQRRALIDPEKASLELRPGLGRLPAGWPLIADDDALPAEPGALAAAQVSRSEPKASEDHRGGGRTDTTQCVAVDAQGNAVSATPSGGWIMTSPVIPELGFPLGTRLQMASLDPSHPNALAPGKRPRTTLSPSLAQLADGRWLAFGTPGGDQQDQWTSQFFLRVAAHGERDLQAAIDAPTVHSEHMPSSFWPRRARPGVVSVESRFDPAVLRALEARGHRLDRKGPWDHGRVLAATVDPSGGPHEAAASPRFAIAYAIALP
jgi:gamma-glutamyltranspeptidase/glutathione hydrolase